MKLETFFEKFDQFADAPDAVTKMRELVLHLAVHGNLVSQSAADEPATELLKRSRAEMAKRMAARQAKQEKPAEPVSDDEATFSLPARWVWCRLVDAGQFINGLAFKASDWGSVGRPIIRIQNLSGRNPDYNRTTGKFDTSVLVKDGDILVSWSATLDAFIWRGEEGVLNQHIFRVLPAPLADKGFLYWLLKWVIRQLAESDHAHGLVMSHINRGPFLAHPIPLPPLAEQKRIVAKVDELMSLCDRLEAQQQERETRHAALARASLARFADAPTPANLNFLFHSSFTILPSSLRKSILTLAVQGQLVPQDPNDEPAETDLVCKVPFDIPSNWGWKPLGRLGLCRTGKTPPTGDPTNYGIGLQFIGPGQITLSGRFTTSEKSITRQGLENSTEANAGDILMVCIGGSIGKAAICREPIGFNQQINSLRLQRDLPEFVYLAVAADYFQEQVLANASGSATPIINKAKWEQIPIPLPPLTEQRRIVAKVEQLMALVDALETQLADSRATAANLLSALVAELTGTPNNGKVSVPSASSTGRRGRPRKSV